MKTMHALMIVGGLYLVQSCATTDVASSHRIQKRKYTKGWHISKGGKKHGTSANKREVSHDDVSNQIGMIPKADEQESLTTVGSEILFLKAPVTEEKKEMKSLGGLPRHFQSPKGKGEVKESGCDIIMLKNGEEIEAKVTEIGTSEIKYKNCDNLDGPTFTVGKYDVFKIKYANGTSTLISTISSGNSRTPLSSSEDVSNAMIMAIISFALGMLSIMVFWLVPIVTIVMALMSIILGAIALGKVKGDNSPRAQKAKGFAIWGIVLGSISALIGITYLILLAVLF